MATLTPTIRKAAEQATLTLPFALPAKEWFSPREAGEVCGLSERTIEKLYQQGTQLSGHRHNAAGDKRPTFRIPRAWVLAYMLATADYDDGSLDDALVACLRHRPAASLLRIAAAAQRLAADAPLSR